MTESVQVDFEEGDMVAVTGGSLERYRQVLYPAINLRKAGCDYQC